MPKPPYNILKGQNNTIPQKQKRPEKHNKRSKKRQKLLGNTRRRKSIFQKFKYTIPARLNKHYFDLLKRKIKGKRRTTAEIKKDRKLKAIT